MNLWHEYKRGLKPFVVEEWVDLFFYRPFGFLFTLPLSRTPITPNQVTFFSALVGLASAVAMGWGTLSMLYLGGWLYLLSNILDCTDGQLARMTKRFSRYGRIYDGVADYVVGLAVFLALGIGWRPDTMSPLAWWLLVFFGGIVSTTYQGMHLNHVRQAYLRAVEHANHSNGMVHRGKKKKKTGLKKFFYVPFYYLYRFYLSVERMVRLRVRLPHELTQDQLESSSLKTVLVLWTFTGKGSHVTLLALALFIGKPEYYLWFCLIPGNLWVYTVYLGHRSVVHSLAKQTGEMVNEGSDPGRRPVRAHG